MTDYKKLFNKIGEELINDWNEEDVKEAAMLVIRLGAFICTMMTDDREESLEGLRNLTKDIEKRIHLAHDGIDEIRGVQ